MCSALMKLEEDKTMLPMLAYVMKLIAQVDTPEISSKNERGLDDSPESKV